MSPLIAPPSCHLIVPAGCRIATCRPLIVPPSHQLVAPACCCITSPRPFVALPSRHLVAPAGCRIASRRPLVAPPSRQLVAPACCCIASPCPLIVLRTALLSSRCAGWLLRCRATLSSSRRLVMPPLFVSSRQLDVAPSLVILLSLHCPLILSSCWLVVASPVLVPPSCPLVVAVHCQRNQMPSNAAVTIDHRHHHHRRH